MTRILTLMVCVLSLTLTTLVTQTSQAQGMSNKEIAQEIDDKLENTMLPAIDAVDATVRELIHHIAHEAGVSVVLHSDSDFDYMVDIRIGEISAKHALDLVLDEYELTARVEHGVLRVMGLDYAYENPVLETKVYGVSDLVAKIEGYETETREIGEGEGRYTLTQSKPLSQGANIGDLVDLIYEIIQPDIWDDNGNVISSFNESLVVCTTADVHERIDDLLEKLRAAKK